jgi:hypothetical protein
MTDTDLNSGDIAEMLTAKIKTVQEAEEALRTKDIVVDAAIPDEVEVQKAKTEQTVALTNAPKVIVGVKTTSTKGKKVKDNLQVCLENFRTAPNGSSVKVTALVKMIDIVSKTPKKSVLDEVLAFFRKYKNEDFIQEQNALQGITTVDLTQHYRIRIFYSVMIGLARRTATRKNTSINMIRTIFNSDEIANWVAIQLSR